MDNRQGGAPPPSNRAPKPFGENRTVKSGSEKPFGAKRYEPREDNRFQPRGENRFQNRDEKFQSGTNQNQERKFQPPNERFQPKDGRFQPRESSAPRGKSFKPKWERDEQRPLPRIVSEMQITDGKHRGIYLQSTASAKVRPTARRVREVMFRILHRRVRAGRFLDLCAGSGMVGLEAISRGAMLATFVERSAKMCSVIRKNMEACGVKTGHGEVLQAEAAPFLKQMEKRRRSWDVVYYDPPYDATYDEILDFFARGAALKTRGVLVVEHHAEMFFPEIFGAMKRWRVLVQGETALSFYEKK